MVSEQQGDAIAWPANSLAGGKSSLSLKILRGLPAPWEALLLQVECFPQSLAEGAAQAFFMDAFEAAVRSAYPALHQQVLLQIWKLSAETGSDVLEENVGDWTPEYGLGVWPYGPQPQRWNDTLAMNAAAALFQGNEPMLPAHRLLRLKVQGEAAVDAVEQLRGLGVSIQTFSLLKDEEVDEKTKKIYLPKIDDTGFHRQDFFFPLLDCKTLAQARSSAELDELLCGIGIVLRESAEDRGYLVVSRFPLAPLLSRVEDHGNESVPPHRHNNP